LKGAPRREGSHALRAGLAAAVLAWSAGLVVSLARPHARRRLAPVTARALPLSRSGRQQAPGGRSMTGAKLDVETVAEAYLALLKARGVDWLFANAGTDFAPIIEALVRGAKAGIAMPEPVVVPHEN